MDKKKPSSYTDTQLRVTDVSTPNNPSDYLSKEALSDPTFTSDLSQIHRISWTTEGGFVARGLRSERYHEIIATGDAECEVRTWECQGGVLARAVKWTYGKVLLEKFDVWCADLKRASEARYHGQKSSP